MLDTRTDPVAWATDLIRLEVALWAQVDAALQAGHDLPLTHYESLRAVASAPAASLRVGDLAALLGVTVGGTSKLADRIVAAGLLDRRADPDDRRATRLHLTSLGRRRLDAATPTYAGVVDRLLESTLESEERRRLADYTARLRCAARGEGTDA